MMARKLLNESDNSNLISTLVPKKENSKTFFCSGCKKAILDRFLLKTMNMFWHEDCLKCTFCDCRLGEVGSSLFLKADMLLCKRDYFR